MFAKTLGLSAVLGLTALCATETRAADWNAPATSFTGANEQTAFFGIGFLPPAYGGGYGGGYGAGYGGGCGPSYGCSPCAPPRPVCNPCGPAYRPMPCAPVGCAPVGCGPAGCYGSTYPAYGGYPAGGVYPVGGYATPGYGGGYGGGYGAVYPASYGSSPYYP